MSWGDLSLAPDPREPGAYYDRLGNRYLFDSHEAYVVARRLHVIQWLTGRARLLFI